MRSPELRISGVRRWTDTSSTNASRRNAVGRNPIVIAIAATVSVREARNGGAMLAIESDRLAVRLPGSLRPPVRLHRREVGAIRLEDRTVVIDRTGRSLRIPLDSTAQSSGDVLAALDAWHRDQPLPASSLIDDGPGTRPPLEDAPERVRLDRDGSAHRAVAQVGLLVVATALLLQLLHPNPDGIGTVGVFFAPVVACMVAMAVHAERSARRGTIFVEPDALLIRQSTSDLLRIPKPDIQLIEAVHAGDRSEGDVRLRVHHADGAMAETSLPATNAALMEDLNAWAGLDWTDYLAFRDPARAKAAADHMTSDEARPLTRTGAVMWVALTIAAAFPFVGFWLFSQNNFAGPGGGVHPFVYVWLVTVGGIAGFGLLGTRGQWPWQPKAVVCGDWLVLATADRERPAVAIHRRQIVEVDLGLGLGMFYGGTDQWERAVLVRTRPVEGLPAVPPTLALRTHGTDCTPWRLQQRIEAWRTGGVET